MPNSIKTLIIEAVLWKQMASPCQAGSGGNVLEKGITGRRLCRQAIRRTISESTDQDQRM